MKNRFKKFAVIALSSLEILALVPSAFCSKPMNPKRFAMEEMPKRTVVVQDQGDLFPGRYITPIYGNLIAPYITGVVKKGAFRNQSQLTSISLPWAQVIEERAFEGCTSLETIFLTESLKCIYPKTFQGCNPNVVINFAGYEFTLKGFIEYCINPPQQFYY